jgi:GTP pyrophosphokinase
MVKVREDYTLSSDGKVDIERWVRQIESQTNLDDPEQFRHACEMAAVIDHRY